MPNIKVTIQMEADGDVSLDEIKANVEAAIAHINANHGLSGDEDEGYIEDFSENFSVEIEECEETEPRLCLTYNNESMPFWIERYQNNSIKMMVNCEDGVFEASYDPHCRMPNGQMFIRHWPLARAMQKQGLCRILDAAVIDGMNRPLVSFLGNLPKKGELHGN